LKVLVIAAIAIIGLAALGGGGWFVYGLVASGYSSPEAVFAAAVQARRDKDYQKLFGTLTPDTQSQLSGTLLVAAIVGGEREPAFKEVLARNSVDQATLQTKYNLAPGNILGLMSLNEQKVKEISDTLGNKGAFFADVLKTMEGKSVGGAFRGASGMNFDDGTTPELKNVVITGDTAVGTQSVMIASRQVDSSMAFRRVDGRWYLDFKIPSPFSQMPRMPLPATGS
jgi:hypothetical protein